MSLIYIYVYFYLFTVLIRSIVGGTSPAVSIFFPRLLWAPAPHPFFFPWPFTPSFMILAVLSRIQTEEMFPSCFLKGVRLLSSFSRHLGSVWASATNHMVPVTKARFWSTLPLNPRPRSLISLLHSLQYVHFSSLPLSRGVDFTDVVDSFIPLSVFVSGTGPTEFYSLLNSSCTMKKSHIRLVNNCLLECLLLNQVWFWANLHRWVVTKQSIYVLNRKVR